MRFPFDYTKPVKLTLQTLLKYLQTFWPPVIWLWSNPKCVLARARAFYIFSLTNPLLLVHSCSSPRVCPGCEERLLKLGYLSIPWTPKSHFNVSSILICSPRPIMPDTVARLQVDLGFNSHSTPSLLSPTARRNRSHSASFYTSYKIRHFTFQKNINTFKLIKTIIL